MYVLDEVGSLVYTRQSIGVATVPEEHNYWIVTKGLGYLIDDLVV